MRYAWAFLALILLPTIARAKLVVEQEFPGVGNKYYLQGSISDDSLRKLNKNQINRLGNIAWPSSYGVYIFMSYSTKPSYATLAPIYAGESQDPFSVTGLWAYIKNLTYFNFRNWNTPLDDIDPNKLNSVSVFICDYRDAGPTWYCTGSDVGEITVPTPPPPKQNCRISGGIQLNHQSVSLDSVNNNTTTTSAYVTCETNARVKIAIAPNSGRVQLRGVNGSTISGLYSNLYANGKGQGQVVYVNATTWGTAIELKSILESNSSTGAGQFQGGSYLEVTYD